MPDSKDTSVPQTTAPDLPDLIAKELLAVWSIGVHSHGDYGTEFYAAEQYEVATKIRSIIADAN